MQVVASKVRLNSKAQLKRVRRELPNITVTFFSDQIDPRRKAEIGHINPRRISGKGKVRIAAPIKRRKEGRILLASNSQCRTKLHTHDRTRVTIAELHPVIRVGRLKRIGVIVLCRYRNFVGITVLPNAAKTHPDNTDIRIFMATLNSGLPFM